MGNTPVKVDPKGKETLVNILEEMKQNKRMIERAARKIERERAKLEQNEKKHMKDITKLAKAG
jgi:DNA-binding PadR family transcriptional regulator